jgi:hypothetical protein
VQLEFVRRVVIGHPQRHGKHAGAVRGSSPLSCPAPGVSTAQRRSVVAVQTRAWPVDQAFQLSSIRLLSPTVMVSGMSAG